MSEKEDGIQRGGHVVISVMESLAENGFIGDDDITSIIVGLACTNLACLFGKEKAVSFMMQALDVAYAEAALVEIGKKQ